MTHKLKEKISAVAFFSIITIITIFILTVMSSLTDRWLNPQKGFYQSCENTKTTCDYLTVVEGQTLCVIIRAYEPEEVK